MDTFILYKVRSLLVVFFLVSKFLGAKCILYDIIISSVSWSVDSPGLSSVLKYVIILLQKVILKILCQQRYEKIQIWLMKNIFPISEVHASIDSSCPTQKGHETKSQVFFVTYFICYSIQYLKNMTVAQSLFFLFIIWSFKKVQCCRFRKRWGKQTQIKSFKTVVEFKLKE